jgi:hypothetical protein
MTSDEIFAVYKDWDTPTPECASRVLMGANSSPEASNFRINLEIAYQLALLNEQIGGVLNSRVPQIRVMCESGEWPLQVQVQERR